MIKILEDAWYKNKDAIEDYFKTTPQSKYNNYRAIVEKLFEIVVNPMFDYDYKIDIKKITEIDDGDYQGTLIYIMPFDTYQPNEYEYLVTSVSYGSCSGCDTLLSISGYEDGLPSASQVKDYMTLALHLLQKTHYLWEE